VTGVTLELASWQADILRRFADGAAHRTRSPVRNLVRRGFLDVARPGVGRYRITSLGRLALDAYDEGERC
jgi:hypothetical protein